MSRTFLILLTLGTVVAVFVLPMIGQVIIVPQIFGGETLPLDESIYWNHRFPRTILALFAGAGLAISGTVFQAVFRNPLATPYTLGIASGASFGASLYIILGSSFGFVLFGISGGSWFAFVGAMLAIGIVHSLSLLKRGGTEQMLLAGVAVNFFFASLILLLQYVSDPSNTVRMLRWTMGGLVNANYADLKRLAPIVLVISATVFVFSRELNVLLTGEERAISLGINVGRFRTTLLLLMAVLTGGIVAVCGPIGFIGLMVPHLVRLMFGPDHRLLIPGTFLFGAVFLGICDTFARSILSHGSEIPVGIVTSLLGGPFFLWLLLRKNCS